jgi:cysteinyl-tRNA synthetase
MLQASGEKMAKSVGNIAPLHEVLDEDGRDAVIMFFLGGHYRQPIDFADAPMQQAAANVKAVREVARSLRPGPSPPELREHRDRFFGALADDFHTPRALAALFGWIGESRRAAGAPPGDADLREMLAVIGLEGLLEAPPAPPDAVVGLAEERLAARERGEFARADELREALATQGWEVRDTSDGFELLPR